MLANKINKMEKEIKINRHKKYYETHKAKILSKAKEKFANLSDEQKQLIKENHKIWIDNHPGYMKEWIEAAKQSNKIK